MSRSRTRTVAVVALTAALALPWGAASSATVPTVMVTCCSPNSTD